MERQWQNLVQVVTGNTKVQDVVGPTAHAHSFPPSVKQKLSQRKGEMLCLRIGKRKSQLVAGKSWVTVRRKV